MKCGDKWNRAHRCPKQVPLHVFEELLEVMDVENQGNQDHEEESSDEEVLSLSLAAAKGIQGKRTLRLQGIINHQELLILVDSGSSSTFISQGAVERLGCTTQQTTEVTMTAANGGKLASTTLVPQVTWWTQGHTFSTTTRVLDLKYYDMILGMDWLETHSPMWVHWKKKKMRFHHNGKRITISCVKIVLISVLSCH